MSNKLKQALIIVAVGTIIWFIPAPDGVKPQAWHLFAVIVATILGFMLQPLPIGTIAFTSIIVTVLTNLLKPAEALKGFSNTTIWLVVAAYFMAKGFIKTGLGKRIAYYIVKAIGGSTLNLGYSMVITDLLISPAMPSNTARANSILFPIVRSLAGTFDSEPGPSARRLGAYLMQTAYQGHAITSAMFMTAMTGNPLCVEFAAQTFGINIDWSLWAVAASVPGIIALIVMPFLLYILYPPELIYTPEAKGMAAAELFKMGPISAAEKIMACIFISVLVLWMTTQSSHLDATFIAMLGVAIMLVTKVLQWQDILEEKGAWDTMILIGSITVLANFLTKYEFTAWFTKLVSGLVTGIEWVPALLVLMAIYMYAHYGFSSLIAHITAMYAAFATIAVAAGVPIFLAALALAFMSSLCMSLTHYAAGPSRVYFEAGYVDQEAWWYLGFIVSVVNMIIWVGIGSIWWSILGLW